MEEVLKKDTIKDENGNEVRLSDFAGQCRNRFEGGWDNYVI